MRGVRSDFKPRGIKGNYWRFFTTPHQQKALLKLSQSLGGSAMVVYASPAFHSHVSLYQHTDNGTMVENSTFVTPDTLMGHKSWNYDRPGTTGIAASIPSSHHGPDFYTLLDRRVSEARPETVSRGLENISLAVEKTVSSLRGNPIAARYKTVISRATEEGGIEESSKPEVIAFQRSVAFMSLLGLTWFVAGRPLSDQ